MVMAEVLSRDFSRLAFIDNEIPEGIHIKDDLLKTSIEGGIYTFDATIEKSKDNNNHIHVKEGNYISMRNRQGHPLLMTIMSVEEDASSKRIYCEDATINLINRIVPVSEAPKNPQPIEYYLNSSLKAIGWNMTNSGVTGKKILEFQNSETALQRIKNVVHSFEGQFYFEITHDRERNLIEPVVHIVKRRVGEGNNDPGFRVSTDGNLKGITRSINMDNLVTKLYVYGVEDLPEELSEQTVSKYDNMKKKLLQWFIDRQGGVTYSMKYRGGGSSYDCSSALYSALIYAGFKPKGTKLGTTVSLWNDVGENKLMTEIKASEVQRGDIFLSGKRGAASGGANGHTGVFLNSEKIIHCNAADNGISITNKSRGGYPMYYFRLNDRWSEKKTEPSQPSKPTTNIKVDKAIQVAEKQIGKRYVWGANGPNAFDCSGLIYYCYRQAGIKFNHRPTTHTMVAGRAPFKRISRNQLRRGDLVMSHNNGHVGLYIGNNMMIVADNPRDGVVKRRAFDGHVSGYVRVNT